MSISLLDMNPLNNDNDYNNNNHSSPGQENTIQGVNKDDDRAALGKKIQFRASIKMTIALTYLLAVKRIIFY
jgi:hypothetical protein